MNNVGPVESSPPESPRNCKIWRVAAKLPRGIGLGTMGCSVRSASKPRGLPHRGGRRSGRMARTWLILSALVAGLALGVGWTPLVLAGLPDTVAIADSVGRSEVQTSELQS